MKNILILALLIGASASAFGQQPSARAAAASRTGKAPAARVSRGSAPRNVAPAPAAAEEKKDETPAANESSSGDEKRKGIITGVSVR